MRKFFLIAALLLVIGIIGVALTVYRLTIPLTVEQTFVEINRGTSTRGIADQLAREGVIHSPFALLAVRVLRPGTRLQAGEYEFSGTVTAWQVYDKIRQGQVFYEEVTIPEGSNIFDISAVLAKTDTIKAENFLASAKDPKSIHDLDPIAPSLEGYLFPSTYRITHKTTAREFCKMMTDEFRRQWKAVGGAQTDVHRIVTLASLVEKETAVGKERPLVAAVFVDRLQLSMPLQCDPTTVYAALLENRYRGTIYKSDLASTNAYNTYAHSGLPPGPIANPGAESLKAALRPAQSNALYFVAKGDGSGAHRFSVTLAEHEEAVRQYRKMER